VMQCGDLYQNRMVSESINLAPLGALKKPIDYCENFEYIDASLSEQNPSSDL